MQRRALLFVVLIGSRVEFEDLRHRASFASRSDTGANTNASERPTQTFHFDEYQRQRPAGLDPTTLLQHLHEPWKPFQSLEEFEFAEVTLEAGLNQKQTDKLISVVRRLMQNKPKFSFTNHRGVRSAWEKAALYHTQVRSLTASPAV